MNLRQLEYFVTVAETLSFTKTAEKFFISQTAITQQVKALEDQLDVVLLKRTKRHVELTVAGAVFLTEAKAILNQMAKAIEKTKIAATGISGSLSLGIIQGYENTKMPDILRAFHSAYPNISLSIYKDEPSNLYSALLNQTMDVVINAKFNYSQLEKIHISYKVLEQHTLIAMLPPAHPLASLDTIDLSDLKNEKFIFPAAGKDSFGYFESTMDHFIRAGFTPQILQTADSFSTYVLLVAAGMGIAILPSYSIVSAKSLGNVVTIPLSETADTFEIIAARYAHNSNPTIDNFWSFL